MHRVCETAIHVVDRACVHMCWRAQGRDWRKHARQYACVGVGGWIRLAQRARMCVCVCTCARVASYLAARERRRVLRACGGQGGGQGRGFMCPGPTKKSHHHRKAHPGGGAQGVTRMRCSHNDQDTAVRSRADRQNLPPSASLCRLCCPCLCIPVFRFLSSPLHPFTLSPHAQAHAAQHPHARTHTGTHSHKCRCRTASPHPYRLTASPPEPPAPPAAALPHATPPAGGEGDR